MGARRTLKFVGVELGRTRGKGRRWATWLAYLLPLLPAVLGAWAPRRIPFPGEYFVPGSLVPGWWTALMWTSAIASVGCFLASRFLNARPRPHTTVECDVVVEGENLQLLPSSAASPKQPLAPARRIPLRDIVQALATTTIIELAPLMNVPRGTTVDRNYVPSPHPARDDGGWRLDIRLRDGERLHLVLETKEAAKRLAKRLLADGVTTRARWELQPALARWQGLPAFNRLLMAVCWLVALVATYGSMSYLVAGTSIHAALGGTLAVSALATMFLGWRLARRPLTVGAEGIVVGGWPARVIRFEEMQHVSEMAGRPSSLEVTLRHGKSIKMIPAADSRHVTKYVTAALHHYRDDLAATAHDVQALERGGRSAARWAEEVSALAKKNDYRSKKLRVEDLEQLVGDGHANPEARVAAALGLTTLTHAKKHIRIAIDAAADDDLRQALEAAAAGEVAERPLARAVSRHVKSQHK